MGVTRGRSRRFGTNVVIADAPLDVLSLQKNPSEQPICTVALVIRTFSHPLSEAGIAALRRITNIMQNDQVLRKACSQQ
jgi:hypothetical protein